MLFSIFLFNVLPLHRQYLHSIVIKLIQNIAMAVLGGIDQPGGAGQSLVEPEVAHLLRGAGRGEAARNGAGDAVEASHDEEGGKVVVEKLAGGDGEVMNETKGVDTVHRREEDLPSDQVTVMFEELHHHVGSRAVTHQDDVVVVQLQARVETVRVKPVLEVGLHPGLDVEDPLSLVVGGGVGEQSPALDDDNPVTGNSTTSTVIIHSSYTLFWGGFI